VVFFELRNLLLQRVDQRVAVLDIRVLGVSLRHCLVGLSLLLFALELQLLKVFLLRLVSELRAL